MEDHGDQRDTVFAEALGVFETGGINFVNLDCTFDTSGDSPNPDEYLVSATPGQLALLQQLGVSIISQANNHSMDYGARSLRITQDRIAELGIEFVGAGRNLEDARAARVISKRGTDVGFLAYASAHPWVGSVIATADSAGVAPLELEHMQEDVKQLQERVDCVVVSAHWGKEYLNYPAPQIIQLAHDLVDCGADIVIGHHPHVIQGIEHYRHGTICYSLGNLLFPDYVTQGLRFDSDQTRRSLVAKFLIEDGRAVLENVEPTFMDIDGRLKSLGGPAREIVLSDLREYSSRLSSNGYDRFWHREAKQYEKQRLWRVFNEEVVQAGWKVGATRLLRLSRKSLKSVGRSIFEIADTRESGRKQT